MATGIEEQILRLEIAVSYALLVQVLYTSQHLPETALDFTRRHCSVLDRGIKVSAGTEFHHFAPVLIFVVNKIHGLNDVGVM